MSLAGLTAPRRWIRRWNTAPTTMNATAMIASRLSPKNATASHSTPTV